ncbi:zinc finger, CCHC-type containing protein [Tanacetum coccineum]
MQLTLVAYLLPYLFTRWSDLRIVLSVKDKLDYLEQPIPPAHVPAQVGQQVTSEALAARTAWVKGSKEIAGLMLMTMEPDTQKNLENLSAYDMLQELKTLFAQQAKQELLQTVRDFHSCKQEEGQNLTVLANYNMHSMRKTVNELHAMLKLHEQTLTKKDPALHYLAELLKNKKLSQGASGSVLLQMNSSVYAVSNKRSKLNLDSALLWHCRLGHISKKRIEKLQHDGLLNSTDLRAFEKCVSCMSRKMARKPYTHQVERAKDQLGLIHTDVCGPFYNLDDENQLEKTIKSLRSDRGGEYMSQEFLDPLKKHGIIAHHTPPYTPQHNEEDTRPSIDTSLNHEEDDLEIDEPQSDIIPICRSTRIRNAPNRMCLYIDAEEHELGDLGEPVNYKAALLDPESDKWMNAMNVEMQSIKDNEV